MTLGLCRDHAVPGGADVRCPLGTLLSLRCDALVTGYRATQGDHVESVENFRPFGHGAAWGSALVRPFVQLSLPAIVFGPPVRKRVDHAGLPDLHGGSQHVHGNLPWQRLISHSPEGMAERMLHEQRPRGLDLLGDLPDQGRGDGGWPGGFPDDALPNGASAASREEELFARKAISGSQTLPQPAGGQLDSPGIQHAQIPGENQDPNGHE
jgi:hypothetical protein